MPGANRGEARAGLAASGYHGACPDMWRQGRGSDGRSADDGKVRRATVSSRPEFIPFALPDITDREIDAVVAAIRTGWLTTGPSAKAFESEFANYLGDPTLEAVAVNSATAGLHLAVEALGLGPGDEVLVPTWTFTATAEIVRYVGATPVLVDVDPLTLNIDLADAESRVTERTRAVVPVHFAGLPIDRSELAGFAATHDLRVIEDAAHAFPVKSSGQLVGTGPSDAVVFSFYASKTMTTGEGGMLVTADPDLAARARVMRLHGISRDAFDRYRSSTPAWRYEVVAPGFKYNLTDPAAAMGRVQLQRAAEMRDSRRLIAERYTREFKDLPVQLPVGAGEPDGHAWHLYVLRLTDEAPLTRDEFIDRMAQEGVGTSVHFIPLHLHPYWRDSLSVGAQDLPAATESFGRAVSLPLFSSMSDEQVDRVVGVVSSLLGAA